MRLQVDPTIILRPGRPFVGNLRRSTCSRTVPNNTYPAAGLPAQPIACPGSPSLRAALHPAKTDCALATSRRGDGLEPFLAQHPRAPNRAVPVPIEEMSSCAPRQCFVREAVHQVYGAGQRLR